MFRVIPFQVACSWRECPRSVANGVSFRFPALYSEEMLPLTAVVGSQ